MDLNFLLYTEANGSNNDRIYRYDLTAPYDVSTCVFVANVNPDTTAIQDGWRYGSLSINNNHVQGIEINPDGTKIFLSFNDVNILILSMVLENILFQPHMIYQQYHRLIMLEFF